MAHPPITRVSEPRSVLKDLYDSEINFSIVTFWHGMDVKLGDEWNGIKAEKHVMEWEDAEGWLMQEAIRHYPGSVFALIYGQGLSEEQALARQQTLGELKSLAAKGNSPS